MGIIKIKVKLMSFLSFFLSTVEELGNQQSVMMWTCCESSDLKKGLTKDPRAKDYCKKDANFMQSLCQDLMCLFFLFSAL